MIISSLGSPVITHHYKLPPKQHEKLTSYCLLQHKCTWRYQPWLLSGKYQQSLCSTGPRRQIRAIFSAGSMVVIGGGCQKLQLYGEFRRVQLHPISNLVLVVQFHQSGFNCSYYIISVIDWDSFCQRMSGVALGCSSSLCRKGNMSGSLWGSQRYILYGQDYLGGTSNHCFLLPKEKNLSNVSFPTPAMCFFLNNNSRHIYLICPHRKLSRNCAYSWQNFGLISRIFFYQNCHGLN